MPGEVKIRFDRPLPKGGEIRNAVVSMDSAGRYFVSIMVKEEIATLPPLKARIGIDLGLTHFATISTGEKIDNPRHFDRHYKRLRRAQKSLSTQKERIQKPRQSPPQSRSYSRTYNGCSQRLLTQTLHAPNQRKPSHRHRDVTCKKYAEEQAAIAAHWQCRMGRVCRYASIQSRLVWPGCCARRHIFSE